MRPRASRQHRSQVAACLFRMKTVPQGVLLPPTTRRTIIPSAHATRHASTTRSSLSRPATIHRQRSGGDLGRGVSAQEGHNTADLLGCGELPRGLLLFQ